MIFDLIKDFTDVLEAMPKEHPRYRILKLLDEAARRDVHFIGQHPTAFFQCMWNTCWWYDCPEAAEHYEVPESGWRHPPPWKLSGIKLCEVMNFWHSEKKRLELGSTWVRSLRPIGLPLNSGILYRLRVHTGKVRGLAVSRDGRFVAFADQNSIHVCEHDTGREMLTITDEVSQPKEPNPEIFFVFSPAGTELAGTIGNDVVLWNFENGSVKGKLLGHEKKVRTVSFFPTGDRLLTSADDGSIRVWDLQHGEEITSLRVEEFKDERNDTFLSPDGKHAARLFQRELWLYTTAEMSVVNLFPEATVAAWSSDGTILYHSSGEPSPSTRDTTSKLFVKFAAYCVHRGNSRQIQTRIAENIKSLAISPDGSWFAIGNGGSVRVLDTDGDEYFVRQEVGFFSWFADSWTLATQSTQGNEVIVWDIDKAPADAPAAFHGAPIIAAYLSPDGTRLATVSTPSPHILPTALTRMHQHFVIHLWSTSNGSLRCSMCGVIGFITQFGTHAVWSPDSSSLAIVKRIQSKLSLGIWNGHDPEVTTKFLLNEHGPPRSLTWSRDSRKIAMLTSNRYNDSRESVNDIIVWNVENEKMIIMREIFLSQLKGLREPEMKWSESGDEITIDSSDRLVDRRSMTSHQWMYYRLRLNVDSGEVRYESSPSPVFQDANSQRQEFRKRSVLCIQQNPDAFHYDVARAMIHPELSRLHLSLGIQGAIDSLWALERVTVWNENAMSIFVLEEDL